VSGAPKTTLWLLCLCWLASCTAEPGAPRIVLQIESDLSVPAELDRVTVEVLGQTQQRAAEADLRSVGLPRTVTLEHASGPLGPVRVTVRGWLDQTAQLDRQLALYFRADAEERVLVTLGRDCLHVRCPAEQTCERGSCVPVAGGSSEVDASVASDAGPGPGADAGGSADAAAGDAGPGSDAGDGSGGPPRDAGTAGDAGIIAPVPDAAARDAAVADAGAADTGVPVVPPGPGARPACTIERPVQNDLVQIDVPLTLRGTCTDPETGPITAGLSWVSQPDGALGSGGALTVMLHSTGRHRLTLCAPDPRDVTVTGCANVEVVATDVAQPTALITAVSQSGSEAPPFVVGQPIQLRGAGTGAGVTLSWRDSLQGELGMGTTATLQMPLPGQHTVTLTVRDRDGKTATRTVEFTVRPRPPMMMGP